MPHGFHRSESRPNSAFFLASLEANRYTGSPFLSVRYSNLEGISMSKANSLVVFGLVTLAGQAAYGQEVVSLYGSNAVNPIMIELPPEGFVMTDIFFAGNLPAAGDEAVLDEVVTGQSDERKASLIIGEWVAGTIITDIHFRSGIAFSAASPPAKVRVDFLFTPTEQHRVTISGYIPSTTGNVPAVGAWGLTVMVLMILAGGTVVMKQRRSAA